MNHKLSRIQLFEAIRDIPYVLADSTRDTSCTSKAKMLGEIFSRMGFECRLARCQFNWSHLDLPEWLLGTIATEIPSLQSNHTFLEIRLEKIGLWISLDPTWDKALSPTLPLVSWDGLTSTQLAVKPLNDKTTILTDSNMQHVRPEDLEFPNRDTSNKFIKQFNRWLEDIRKLNQTSLSKNDIFNLS